MSRKHLFIIAILLLTLAAPLFASDGSALWQIGVPDKDYKEFGITGRYDAYIKERSGGATFEVSKSTPEKSWIYVQPGPKDESWAGQGEHPFEIVFDLDTVPTGPFVLRIGLVDVSPKYAPTLRVRVNDEAKYFKLKSGKSESSLRDASNGLEQSIEMYVASGFLQKGRNVINFTVTKGSYVLYDYISFDKTKAPMLFENLSLQPTYLFKKRGNELKQIANAVFNLYEDQKLVKVNIKSEQGWQVEQDFRDVKSGHRKLEVEIDPVSIKQNVHIKVSSGLDSCEADGMVVPEKRWKIYMMPSSHFDYGYTSVQDKAMDVHLGNIDRAIEWSTRYPDFKWDLEGSFIADEYLKRGAHKNEFEQLVKQKRIGVMGFFDNHLTAVCSGEELSRLVDFYDYIRNTYGVESKCAMLSDVPSMVATIPMYLREHGIKYLSHGTNTSRASGNEFMQKTPYYWEAPDGSRVLMWKIVGQYAQAAELTGLDDSGHIGLAMDRITSLLNDFSARKDYPYDAVLEHSAYGDNWPSGISLPQVPDEWNRRYEYPKLIFSNGPDFFEYIENNFSKYIKTVKGDGGGWWEDGVASSAYETGVSRVAKEKLATAERVTSLCDADYQKQTKPEIAAAWKNAVLYDEHTWGSAISMDDPYNKDVIDQWNVKKGFAEHADKKSGDLLEKALDQFSKSITAQEDSVLVFNPSSWNRSETVKFKAPGGSEMILYADGVPGLGYKIIPIKNAQVEISKPASDDTLENLYYIIKFDKSTGAVSSIYDKDLKRELIDSSAYGANGYLYVLREENRISDTETKTLWNIQKSSEPTLEKSLTPGRQIMQISCKAPFEKTYSAQVILYDNEKRIDFINSLDKIENLKKETVYFAFPFAFKNPEIRMEIPGGVVRPEVDQLWDGCRDWYSVQHFLTISDADASVVWTALDSPLVTLQDINRDHWYKHLKIENGNVFAYVMTNLWWTNYKASQFGPMTFRFSITSSKKTTDLQAKQFGESVQSPLLCKVIQASSKDQAPQHSLIEIKGEGIVLQSMAPARFTDGVVLCLREMNGKSETVQINPASIKYKKAYLSNLAEDKISEINPVNGVITVTCRPLGLTTLLLER